MVRQRLLLQIVCLGLIVALLVGCSVPFAKPTAVPTLIPPTPASLGRLDGQQALFVAYVHFHEDEYGIPRVLLEELGVTTTFASLSPDTVMGSGGTGVQPDVLLSDVHGGDYDAVIFLGGAGYQVDEPEAQRITQEAVAAGKVVAAICFAPITLAKAGVLVGKQVTAGYLRPKHLEEAGAIYTGAQVERDGLIITANGPRAARAFGETIAAAMGERVGHRLDGQRALFVVPDGYSEVEYGIPRRILEELGAVVTIASWTPDTVTGHRGAETQPEVLLSDIHAGDYDAIIFVGGSGVRPTDPDTQRIVQEAIAGDRVLAAICAAQGILTRAGLLEGKRADGPYVERSGRIITASGPIKAREFGETIAAAMGERVRSEVAADRAK